MPDQTETISLEVLRYRPEQDQAPSFQTYTVPYTDDLSILEALHYVKDELDDTLSYRWSCRMAICGSCGMMVNGVPHLACKTFLREFKPGPIKIEPLTNFPIERDLVIVADDFIKKLQTIKPYIIREDEKPLEEGEHLQLPAQLLKFEQYSHCINCLLCYAACPQYGLNEQFTGPAALALIHRYNQDSRDQGQAERLPLAHGEDGVWNCTFVGYCSEVCPKEVDPAAAIQQNKVGGAMNYMLSFVMPKGASK
jgi:fumarate reductase iron-sulfur subunit